MAKMPEAINIHVTDVDALIKGLIDRVKTEQVEVQMTLEPERTEIIIQPWKEIEMKCPYRD